MVDNFYTLLEKPGWNSQNCTALRYLLERSVYEILCSVMDDGRMVIHSRAVDFLKAAQVAVQVLNGYPGIHWHP